MTIQTYQWRTTFVQTVAVMLAILSAYLIYRLNELIIVLFVGLVFASTVRPIMNWLRRRGLPLGVAVTTIYLALILAIVGMLVLVVPAAISLYIDVLQEGDLAQDINYALVSLSFSLRRQFATVIPILALPDPIRDMLASAEETVTQGAMPLATSAAYVAGQIALAVVISVYWLTSRSTILNNMLRLTPAQYRTKLRDIWLETEDTLGSYFSYQILLGVIIGVACYIGLLIMRVPNALALAVIAGIMEFVPFVGPTISLIPAVLMALSISPYSAIGIAVWYTVVQQIEGSYLVPMIMGRCLRLHPLLVLIAFFAGFYLNGVLGALLAIPIVGVLQVSFRHLRDQPEEVEVTDLLPEDDIDTEENKDAIRDEAPDDEVLDPAVAG